MPRHPGKYLGILIRHQGEFPPNVKSIEATFIPKLLIQSLLETIYSKSKN